MSEKKDKSLGQHFFEKLKKGDYSKGSGSTEKPKYGGQDQSKEARDARRKSREAAKAAGTFKDGGVVKKKSYFNKIKKACKK